MSRKPGLAISLLVMALLLIACGAEPELSKNQSETVVEATQLAATNQLRTTASEQPTVVASSQPTATVPQAFPEPQLASTSASSTSQQAWDEAIDIMRSGRTLIASSVYTGPTQDSMVVGELEAGDLVIVTRALDNWYEIIFIGDTTQHAWLPQEAVTFEAAPQYSAVSASESPADTSTQTTAPPTLIPTVEIEATAVKREASAVSSKASQPQNGAIVFQTSSGGAIYTMNADGSNLQLLTTGGLDPALSPDGTQVAYTRWDEPRGLFVVNTDGTNERRLVGDNFVKNPTWSPDGERIAYNLQLGGPEAKTFEIPFLGREFTIPADPHWRLQVIDADGENLEGLVDNMHSFNPDWSEYGILYAAEDGIYMTYADGSNQPFFLNANQIRNPSWSPDGQYVVAMMEFHDHWEVVRLNADGSGLVRLAKNYDRVSSVSPVWSPDGKSILYLTDQNGEWELWQMDADGSNPHPFAPDALADIAFRYDFNAEQVVDWR